MSTRQTPIEEATDDQLRSFLTTFLQIEVGPTVNSRAKLLAELSRAWKQPFIHVGEDAELVLQDSDVAPSPVVKDLSALYQDDPKVELVLDTTAYPGGEEPASPNVNGKMLVIQRGVKVRVPYRFYDALLNAFEDKTVQDPNDPGKLVVTRVSNFPMREVKLPPQAEIEAWFERTKDKVLG